MFTQDIMPQALEAKSTASNKKWKLQTLGWEVWGTSQ